MLDEFFKDVALTLVMVIEITVLVLCVLFLRETIQWRSKMGIAAAVLTILIALLLMVCSLGLLGFFK